MTKLNISAERARLAMTCMAKNDIRYYLNGILVEPRAEGGVFIVGTNGHRLIAVIDESGVCEEPTILRIDAALVGRCSKPHGASKNVQRLQLDEFRGKPALLLTDRDTGELPDYVEFSPILDGKFPNWRQVLPDLKKVKRGHASAFNADYLHSVLSILKIGSRVVAQAIPYQELTDDPGASAGVIAFHIVGFEYAYLAIMPLRDRGSDMSIDAFAKRWPIAALKKAASAKKEEVPA